MMLALTDGYLRWYIESDGKSFRAHFDELNACKDKDQAEVTVVDVFCESLFGYGVFSD